MRVVPVDEDPGRVGAGASGDPVEQEGDLRLTDADDVDAAEHDPPTVLLEGKRRGLETPPSVARRVVRLADEAHERQAERRLERQPSRTGQERAAQTLTRSETRTGCPVCADCQAASMTATVRMPRSSGARLILSRPRHASTRNCAGPSHVYSRAGLTSSPRSPCATGARGEPRAASAPGRGRASRPRRPTARPRGRAARRA